MHVMDMFVKYSENASMNLKNCCLSAYFYVYNEFYTIFFAVLQNANKHEQYRNWHITFIIFLNTLVINIIFSSFRKTFPIIQSNLRKY